MHVFISGGARGIGRKIVERFYCEGYNVSFIYSSDYNAERLISEICGKVDSTSEDRIIAVKADVSDSEQVSQAVEVAVRKFGTIDVLISNSGISKVGLATDFSFDDYHKVMDVNFGGLFNLCNCVIPMMVHNKCGSIIAISSMWGQRGASCEALYAASKGAVDSYIKSLAQELGPSGIRVNAVSPGVIDTDMLNCFTEDDKAELAEETPLGRLGNPEEIANVVYYLSGSEASFITGQIIGVDGGY